MSSVRRPAEWELHRAVWTAWPEHEDWGQELESARAELAAMARALSESGEQVRILVQDDHAQDAPELTEPGIELCPIPYGDIWLRDTGPLFVWEASGRLGARCFAWNGWGERFDYPRDEGLAERIVQDLGLEVIRRNWVLEGGAIDGNGDGTCLSTRQCLLNDNRGGRSEAEVEVRLREDLGYERVVWLDQGLLNDHTDGHVDTVARFVGPDRVICMVPSPGDPNAKQLRDIERALRSSGFEVSTIPSPGEVRGLDGTLMPASYVNFFIGNELVVVPTYGTSFDEAAVRGVASSFPKRRVIGLSARALLSGGGAFHCITQEQP
ncbi:MAG: agmatine deiminase family protein [Myxococcota bacterium]